MPIALNINAIYIEFEHSVPNNLLKQRKNNVFIVHLVIEAGSIFCSRHEMIKICVIKR